MDGFSKYLVVGSAALLMGLPIEVTAQPSLTSNSDGTLTVSWNPNVVPATGGMPTSTTVQFRIRSNSVTGYRVEASATLTPPAGNADGGAAVSLSDIGVGITSVTERSAVLATHDASIVSGFDYDPSTVTATNGLTPYSGAGSGRATLADVATATRILFGPQMALSESTSRTTNYCTVTLKLALLPQYWTPGSFTITLSLQILVGQS